MKRVLACSIAALIAGCGSQEAEPANSALAHEIEQAAGRPPVNSQEAPYVPVRLEPIHAVEVERELEPGAGCDLTRDGALLLVAVQGAAIAKPGGILTHLSIDGLSDTVEDSFAQATSASV